jgi:hypothetical protein
MTTMHFTSPKGLTLKSSRSDLAFKAFLECVCINGRILGRPSVTIEHIILAEDNLKYGFFHAVLLMRVSMEDIWAPFHWPLYPLLRPAPTNQPEARSWIAEIRKLSANNGSSSSWKLAQLAIHRYMIDFQRQGQLRSPYLLVLSSSHFAELTLQLSTRRRER